MVVVGPPIARPPRADDHVACGTKILRGVMRDRSQLVGTWRMLTWRREFADTGDRTDALGAEPVGFVSYGADGRVHAIVLKRDRPCPAKLPPSEKEKVHRITFEKWAS